MLKSKREKVISLCLVVAFMVTIIPFAMFVTRADTEGINTAEPITIDLANQNITNILLAEMVADGTIPQNTTHLILSGNQISDLAPLSGLTNLELLNLANNQIADLSPLVELDNLETLWLARNQISDISPLSDLINLQKLGLEFNRVTDISPLSSCSSTIYPST